MIVGESCCWQGFLIHRLPPHSHLPSASSSPLRSFTVRLKYQIFTQQLRIWIPLLNHTISSPNVLSRVQLFVAPWIVAHHAPLSMGFSRQEHWSGFTFPVPGALPDPGIKPSSHVSCIGRWILYRQSHLGRLKVLCIYFSIYSTVNTS